MRVAGFVLGWKRKVRSLRKRWDRCREKSLKKKEPIRGMALQKLDTIENSLRMLEEQSLTRMDRERLSKQVEIDLAEVKGLLKTKPGEVSSPAG